MANQEDIKEEDTKEGKPKGGGKKLLIIGLFLGLLVGGGGGFGAFMMLGSGDEAVETVEEVIVPEEPEIDPHFVKIERLNVPLISNNRVLGSLMIDFSLEVDGNDNKMRVIRALPEIRDAMLRHFSEISVGKPDNPKSVDYPLLKNTLKDISNKVLHDSLVLRVMIVQVRQF